MRPAFILVMLSLSLSAVLARADQVTLKNGDRLTGTIVKTDDDKKLLEIKTDLAGEVTVQWDAVTAIESSQPLHLTLRDGRVITGTVRTTDGKLSVASKEAGEVSAEHAAIKAIRNDQEQAEFDRMQHPRLRDNWSGLFDLGLSVTEGNSSALALSIASKAARVVPKNKLSLYYTQVYAKDSNQDPAVTTDVNPGPPMMLASTGLDITVPVVIGLAVLVLGTVMVGWAFLATGRKSQHR